MATVAESLRLPVPAAREAAAVASPSAAGVPRVITGMLAGEGPMLAPLTAEQYLAAIGAGVFAEKTPIELIDGLLLRKDRRDAVGDLMAEGDRHDLTKNLLRDVLEPLVRPLGCHAVTEPPVLLSDWSVPEPDVAVFRGRLIDYRGRLPRASDAAVLIEVSWSSLGYDRQTKLERYAAAGVPAYWIVNLVSSAVEVYDCPDPPESHYGRLRTFDRAAVIALPLFDAGAADVPVAKFLPE